jgi:cytochrome P450
MMGLVTAGGERLVPQASGTPDAT